MYEANLDVLVIDDEPEICDIVQEILSDQHVHCHTTTDPGKAIRMLEDEPISVIISDVVMPGCNGVDLLDEVRQHSPRTPVILMTGQADERSRQMAVRRGVFDYITKPLDISCLTNTVMRALEEVHWRQTRGGYDNNTVTLPLELDLLTGVLTHRFFAEHLESLVTLANKNAEPLCVVLADLDHFSRVNEQYGHGVGDEVLWQVSGRLRRCIRRGDLVGRYGGSQFALALPRAGESEGLNLAERFCRVISDTPIIVGEHIIATTISVGLTCVNPVEGVASSELLDRADRAMRRAKHSGRNQVVAWQAGHEHQLDGTLVAALKADDESIARVGEEFERLNLRLHDVIMGSTQALVAAVEARDPYTKDHSVRVSYMARALAERLGLSEQQIAYVKTAGIVHDIGKIGIPDSILTKPGPLSRMEYELVKRHCHIGCEILEKTTFFQAEIPFVRHHHEWFDGTGYPDRIAGDRIPLGARIISLADAVDVMLTRRSYKQAFSRQQAVAEMRSHSGVQFDPALVEPCIDLLNCGAFDEHYPNAD